MICAACGTELGRPERIGRRDTCPSCGNDLRTCRQCRFYDSPVAGDPPLANATQVAGECREPQAERVLDKTRGNFCDFFSPADAPRAAAASASSRDALERLFKR